MCRSVPSQVAWLKDSCYRGAHFVHCHCHPLTIASICSGVTLEEVGLQPCGIRLSSAMNPDSIWAVMSIVYIGEGFVVNVSNLPSLYSSHNWCEAQLLNQLTAAFPFESVQLCVSRESSYDEYTRQSQTNPQVYVETPLHPEKLFGALYGLVESFFKNDEGHNVTVNGDRYRAMITNFFIPELNNQDAQELWFQQDGATCHTARATIDLLKDTLGDRLISRFGPVNWPPRSCDLTPLDYFLWGYVKSLVYARGGGPLRINVPFFLKKCLMRYRRAK
ncbi:transposable element Tc3 transposase [Trichonephila clavipes]|nr:transposable element Tc3 transposase [Trichonephila clavipes]